MADEVVKLTDSTFKVITQPETPAPVEQEYDVDFLVQQRIRIITDANNYLAARQKELDVVDDLLVKAKACGSGQKAMPSPLENI